MPISIYIYEEETYLIIGILFEVHKNLGKGFSEIVYKDALEYEFTQQKFRLKEKKNIVYITKNLF